ncbi:MAG TPA: helix-turn-helix domain-containing protein [Pseudonocardiaceae bacterium]|nr:helix-turn-helix domain-containing protein [Pseudonocardiaceae bacterium]
MADLAFLDEVVNSGERLRADARATVQEILVAADRVLSKHPAATLDEIAAEAGVARTTIHRRFATRELLLRALDRWAVHQIANALDEADPETAPPYVALYQATANVLRIKINLAVNRDTTDSTDPGVVAANQALAAKADALLIRAKTAGLLRADISIPWARRVYYALVHEAVICASPEDDPAELASLVLSTFCQGFGTRS